MRRFAFPKAFPVSAQGRGGVSPMRGRGGDWVRPPCTRSKRGCTWRTGGGEGGHQRRHRQGHAATKRGEVSRYRLHPVRMPRLHAKCKCGEGAGSGWKRGGKFISLPTHPHGYAETRCLRVI